MAFNFSRFPPIHSIVLFENNHWQREKKKIWWRHSKSTEKKDKLGGENVLFSGSFHFCDHLTEWYYCPNEWATIETKKKVFLSGFLSFSFFKLFCFLFHLKLRPFFCAVVLCVHFFRNLCIGISQCDEKCHVDSWTSSPLQYLLFKFNDALPVIISFMMLPENFKLFSMG